MGAQRLECEEQVKGQRTGRWPEAAESEWMGLNREGQWYVERGLESGQPE